MYTTRNRCNKHIESSTPITWTSSESYVSNQGIKDKLQGLINEDLSNQVLWYPSKEGQQENPPGSMSTGDVLDHILIGDMRNNQGS